MLIIDAHYHLDERMEPLDVLISGMDRHGIDRVALIAGLSDPIHITGITEKLSIIGRVLLGSSYSLLNKPGRLIYRNTVTSDGRFSVPGKKYAIYDNPDNANVAQAITQYPDRFYGWIFVNPAAADPAEEIEKWSPDRSWIGVKSHPFWHRYPVRMLDDTAALCVEKGMPLLVHLGGDMERGDFRYLPDRHPELKLIYAHGGVPFFSEVWEYCSAGNNVFLDLSSPYLDENLRIRTVHAVGPGKCIYGTDGPFGYPDVNGLYDHGAILSEIMRLPVSDSEKELILWKNFHDIAGIP